MIKFSVITVCKNAEKTIKETMESVLEQSYENLEYLIFDGDSTDHTGEMIRKCLSGCSRDVKVYREKDFGIYNAMNRGIAHAAGDYIIFMNAGDGFYDCEVLKNIASYIEKSKCEIYYGMTQAGSRGEYRKLVWDFQRDYSSFLSGILQGHMPCHQSIIASTECLRKHYFNEEYKYRADFEWLVSCYKQKVRVEAIDIIVSQYDRTGVTSRTKARIKSAQETKKILQQYVPIEYHLFLWKKLITEFLR